MNFFFQVFNELIMSPHRNAPGLQTLPRDYRFTSWPPFMCIVLFHLCLSRCPGRFFAAAQSHQLSCVFVARFSVTDDENLKATNYCWRDSGAGGFMPNKDAGHLFSLSAWMDLLCHTVCVDNRLNALLENEPVQNELLKLLHQHSFADESDFQEAAPLQVFQHQYKEGFCLT